MKHLRGETYRRRQQHPKNELPPVHLPLAIWQTVMPSFHHPQCSRHCSFSFSTTPAPPHFNSTSFQLLQLQLKTNDRGNKRPSSFFSRVSAPYCKPITPYTTVFSLATLSTEHSTICLYVYKDHNHVEIAEVG